MAGLPDVVCSEGVAGTMYSLVVVRLPSFRGLGPASSLERAAHTIGWDSSTPRSSSILGSFLRPGEVLFPSARKAMVVVSLAGATALLLPVCLTDVAYDAVLARFLGLSKEDAREVC